MAFKEYRRGVSPTRTNSFSNGSAFSYRQLVLRRLPVVLALEETMKYAGAIIALLVGLSVAHAQGPGGTCKTQAASKKLAGAALTSFMTKCEKDATASCDMSASNKKLAGAAKTSFAKKCVSDAVGK
jgi:hypothetical protein